MRKTRLKGMATKPKKGPVDYLLYSINQMKDAFDFYTDAKLALMCYGIARKDDLGQVDGVDDPDAGWSEKLKFAMIFAMIFFAIASPYLIYYSAYMRLVLFKDSYALNKWAKLSCFGKTFLMFNLTCVGGFCFVMFDLTSKLTAVALLVSLITVPIPCLGSKVPDFVYYV